MAGGLWSEIPVEEYIVILDTCPFCGGVCKFYKSSKHHMIMIAHYPDLGIICPALFEQYCDNQEQGASWWNKRSYKKGMKDAY